MAKFNLDSSKCIYCGGCVSVCPVLAITLHETRIKCDENLCIACKTCEKGCPLAAIKINAPEKMSATRSVATQTQAPLALK